RVHETRPGARLAEDVVGERWRGGKADGHVEAPVEPGAPLAARLVARCLEDEVVGADASGLEDTRPGEPREAEVVAREQIRIALPEPIGDTCLEERAERVEHRPPEAGALDPALRHVE